MDHEGDSSEPKKARYLVRWRGYSPQHDSWEGYKQFIDKSVITEYWNKLNKRNRQATTDDEISSIKRAKTNETAQDSNGVEPMTPKRARLRRPIFTTANTDVPPTQTVLIQPDTHASSSLPSASISLATDAPASVPLVVPEQPSSLSSKAGRIRRPKLVFSPS